MLDDACSHMRQFTRWTVEKAKEAAKKYTTRAEFQSKCYSAYEVLWDRGLLDDACAHMPKRKRAWSAEEAKNAALSFKTRAEFQRENNGAYGFLCKAGILDDACRHMGPAERGYDRESVAILYYMLIKTPSNMTLWKIGITGKSTKDRKKSVGSRGCEITVLNEIWFRHGREARLLERQLHREFAQDKYQGDPVMGNGNTELFTRDVLADYFDAPV